MKRIFVFILLLAVFFSSCKTKNKSLDDILTELNSKIHQIDKEGWIVFGEGHEAEFSMYRLSFQGKDTTKSLDFYYCYEENEELLFNHYIINEFSILIYDRLSKYYYTTEMKTDTLFSYKTLNPECYDSKCLEFIVGKYYFQYYNNELDSMQKVYFIENKDSLMKLRGNDLPELPNN